MTDDLKRWSPELRRAVMKARPEFFSWSPEDRERYGADIPDADEAVINQVLLAELFGQKYHAPNKVRHAVRDMPIPLLARWNGIRLPFIGIGEDSFFLNRGIAGGLTLLDFANLRAYDEAQHHYQERARKGDFADHKISPYRGQLYLDNAWLYVDERFAYGSLSMAAGYIYSELEIVSSDAVRECIPWEFVNLGSPFRREGGRFVLDTRKNAGGQEALLDELQYRTQHYIIERMDALKERWHEYGRRGVYIFESEREFNTGDNEIEFVFTDVGALEAVRFPSFVRDCRVIERPVQELHDAVAAEEAHMRAWVRTQHEELRRTFDPKVAKLRNRRKVMFSAEAVEDIERIVATGQPSAADDDK